MTEELGSPTVGRVHGPLRVSRRVRDATAPERQHVATGEQPDHLSVEVDDRAAARASSCGYRVLDQLARRPRRLRHGEGGERHDAADLAPWIGPRQVDLDQLFEREPHEGHRFASAHHAKRVPVGTTERSFERPCRLHAKDGDVVAGDEPAWLDEAAGVDPRRFELHPGFTERRKRRVYLGRLDDRLGVRLDARPRHDRTVGMIAGNACNRLGDVHWSPASPGRAPRLSR
jgi:hypothetical protein